jgi:tRNA threonylcarbamoyl adenosine modification protein YeaZ
VLALVIDTSSAAVTTGVVTCSPEVRVLAEQVTLNARAHCESLAPSIHAALAKAGVKMADLDAVMAGVGPGTFTGLRVGLVTAGVIADVLSIPSYAVCSLDAMATVTRHHGSLLVAADARRREVYWARYVDGDRQGSPMVTKPGEVNIEANAMVGAGARQYADVLGFPLLDGDFPTVAGVAAMAAARACAAEQSEPLTPLYLRRPDAVAASPRKPAASQ